VHSRGQLSVSELLYDSLFTANQFVLATSPLRVTTSSFFFAPETCGYSPYGTSSLTRGCVCRLQLLLAFASTVILRSESRGFHYLILLSQIRDPLTWMAGSPYLYSPGTGWSSFNPGHLVLFSLPPTTRMATLEVF
jgi:hypothetical protein